MSDNIIKQYLMSISDAFCVSFNGSLNLLMLILSDIVDFILSKNVYEIIFSKISVKKKTDYGHFRGSLF